MSNLVPSVASCPRCGAEQPAALFDSLNAALLPAEVERIRDGSFERLRCPACAHAYQPEHRLLYVDSAARAWIVMQPRADRPRFATLEHGVTLTLERHFAAAPSLVAGALATVRARLVFGQPMLAEAVRVLAAGLDPALVECAKLLAFRAERARLFALGPCELCVERIGDDDTLGLGVHALVSGERLDGLELPPALLRQALQRRDDFVRSHAELFQQPYVSACRYLYGATM